MKASEIREKFLQFFEQKGHERLPSSSLVPQNDPTLLFTNAGMVQFKDAFLGNDVRAYRRATTSQKCVRAGGKHNDLENVGFTARHHTFFEMLGNFSFGDYFKKEAIAFAWEFTTQVLKLPKDKLYVTVFESDDEALKIWHEQEKVPLERIYRFGEKDNFWSMGETGPCGPCSELFIDRGERYGCKKETCGMGCDCDRYIEFWNLVFMQFDRSSDGSVNPLPKPSVDTGAGLERLAMILQSVDSNYETDLFQEIIQKIATFIHKPYQPEKKEAVSFRVIADHARASVFLIADGVLPSNEGRGYVLRRILRRAIRHGKKLGQEKPFLWQTVGFVIDTMKEAYPDLVDKKPFIEKMILAEEEQFLRTLEKGLVLFEEEASQATRVFPGAAAFKLYDTYGFPLDLTRILCSEKGLKVDEAAFEQAMDRQRAESRKHWKGSGEEAIQEVYHKLVQKLPRLQQFMGYQSLEVSSECLAILVQKEDSLVEVSSYETAIESKDIIELVFAETPFYGESGGQIGDRGKIRGEGFEGEVVDVQKPFNALAIAHVIPKKGRIQVGESYSQQTDFLVRGLTAKNHTATHLLQWALREVLGKHVKQAGSLVTPELLRFDFTHFQPLSPQELVSVENLINEKIWKAEAVSHREMPKDEAVRLGAIAFFGEKYGERVRVIQVGDYSTELCGGTHVHNSSEIHLFKIGQESGIASGVRRIIAYTSQGAFQYLREQENHLKKIRDRLKASSVDEILGKIEKSLATEKELKRQLEQLQAQGRNSEVNELLSRGKKVGSVTLVSGLVSSDSSGVKKLRDLADQLKQKAPESISVLGMEHEAKAHLLIAVGASFLTRVQANHLLHQVSSLIDGKGGGKAELAQAGGLKPSGLKEAIEKASQLAQELVS